MELHSLQNAPGARKARKRLGRGPGSTLGKTCGRGHKGQHSRSGSKRRRGFEGGQTPLHRRLPKFGFTNIFKEEYSLVSLSMLESCDDLGSVEVVTKRILKEKGLIKTLRKPVKLLSDGNLTKSLKIEVDRASKVAKEKLEAAGGQIVDNHA